MVGPNAVRWSGTRRGAFKISWTGLLPRQATKAALSLVGHFRCEATCLVYVRASRAIAQGLRADPL